MTSSRKTRRVEQAPRGAATVVKLFILFMMRNQRLRPPPTTNAHGGVYLRLWKTKDKKNNWE